MAASIRSAVVAFLASVTLVEAGADVYRQWHAIGDVSRVPGLALVPVCLGLLVGVLVRPRLARAAAVAMIAFAVVRCGVQLWAVLSSTSLRTVVISSSAGEVIRSVAWGVLAWFLLVGRDSSATASPPLLLRASPPDLPPTSGGPPNLLQYSPSDPLSRHAVFRALCLFLAVICGVQLAQYAANSLFMLSMGIAVFPTSVPSSAMDLFRFVLSVAFQFVNALTLAVALMARARPTLGPALLWILVAQVIVRGASVLLLLTATFYPAAAFASFISSALTLLCLFAALLALTATAHRRAW